MIVGHSIHDQQAVGVLAIVFEFFSGLALRHNVGVLQELAQPKAFPFPVHHGELFVHGHGSFST